MGSYSPILPSFAQMSKRGCVDKALQIRRSLYPLEIALSLTSCSFLSLWPWISVYYCYPIFQFIFLSLTCQQNSRKNEWKPSLIESIRLIRIWCLPIGSTQTIVGYALSRMSVLLQVFHSRFASDLQGIKPSLGWCQIPKWHQDWDDSHVQHKRISNTRFLHFQRQTKNSI